MSATAPTIFDKLAQQETQRMQHDQAASPSVAIDPSDIQVLPTQFSGASQPQPAQSQNISADDVQVLPKDIFDQIAANNGQPLEVASQPQAEPPSFGQRVYEESGLKGIIDTAKQKWAAAQAATQEENKMAGAVVEAVKSKNYGQAAELLLSHISKNINPMGILTGGPVVGMAKDAVMSELRSGAGHIQRGAEDVKKGEYGNAALESIGLIPGLGSTNDRAIEDIKAGNLEGVAGDVTGGAIKAGATYLGAKVLGPAAEEESAAESGISKPGLVKQIKQGAKVAQEPAKAALESGAEASAKDAGIIGPAERGGGIRTMLSKPIATAADTERSLYDTVNEAAETDMKDLFDRKEELLDALNDPTNIANRKALANELATTDDAIKVHSELAASKGISMDVLDEAKAATQQRFAMETLDQKLFNNESVVSGDVAHGVPETINVDAAIRQVQNLDKPSRFAPRGTPTRLVQALGEDGAKALKQGLYDAQAAGQKALKSQQFWTGILKKAGIGGGILAGGGALKHALE